MNLRIAVAALGMFGWRGRPAQMLKAIGVAVAALFAISSVAFADAGQAFDDADPSLNYGPKVKREWPDGPNKEFLKSLQRPDNHKNPHRDKNSQSCCDAGDTVKTKFKVEPGDERYPEDRWYAWIKDAWVPVPPDKIVTDYAPDGQAYLFMLADTIQCFVRPKGGL